MTKPFLFRQRVRAAQFAAHFKRRTDGIAAVEFALIVPIMAILFIGAVEMSQAVTVNRRVSQVGSTIGDIVARADTTIYDSGTDPSVLDTMKVGKYLLAPYGPDTLVVEMQVVGSTSSATDIKRKWYCKYDGANPTTVACECKSDAYTTLPTGLLSTTSYPDYVVVAEVKYGYKPGLFDFFMKRAYPSGSGGVYTMKETVYLKPRSLTPQLKVGSAAVCPL